VLQHHPALKKQIDRLDEQRDAHDRLEALHR
jgi:hypothetical protein